MTEESQSVKKAQREKFPSQRRSRLGKVFSVAFEWT